MTAVHTLREKQNPPDETAQGDEKYIIFLESHSGGRPFRASDAIYAIPNFSVSLRCHYAYQVRGYDLSFFQSTPNSALQKYENFRNLQPFPENYSAAAFNLSAFSAICSWSMTSWMSPSMNTGRLYIV